MLLSTSGVRSGTFALSYSALFCTESQMSAVCTQGECLTHQRNAVNIRSEGLKHSLGVSVNRSLMLGLYQRSHLCTFRHNRRLSGVKSLRRSGQGSRNTPPGRFCTCAMPPHATSIDRPVDS